MKKLLAELEGEVNRRAQFRTAICLIEGGEKRLFEGIVKGVIIEEKRGLSGFGYDPVFVPEGYEETFAEMGNEEKTASAIVPVRFSNFVRISSVKRMNRLRLIEEATAKYFGGSTPVLWLKYSSTSAGVLQYFT